MTQSQLLFLTLTLSSSAFASSPKIDGSCEKFVSAKSEFNTKKLSFLPVAEIILRPSGLPKEEIATGREFDSQMNAPHYGWLISSTLEKSKGVPQSIIFIDDNHVRVTMKRETVVLPFAEPSGRIGNRLFDKKIDLSIQLDAALKPQKIKLMISLLQTNSYALESLLSRVSPAARMLGLSGVSIDEKQNLIIEFPEKITEEKLAGILAVFAS